LFSQNANHFKDLQFKYIFEVEGSTTVLELKQMLEAMEGIPASKARLIFAGRQLEDSRTIQDYNILDGHAIHIVMQLSSD
jgi:hypothetical protein